MEYMPALKIVTSMDDDDIVHTFNYAFACPVVKRIVSTGNTKMIHIDHRNLAPREYWTDLYEALEEHGSVWISSEKRSLRGDDEYEYFNEDLIYGITPLFSVTPKENHWEVCYAKKPNKTLDGAELCSRSCGSRNVPYPNLFKLEFKVNPFFFYILET